jgi:cell division protein FtsL
MKKPMALLSLLFVVIVGLSIVQIALSNQMATTGTELTTLTKKIDDYKKENTLLNEKVLEASSLTALDARAQKLGFVPETSQIDLSTPLPLALK